MDPLAAPDLLAAELPAIAIEAFRAQLARVVADLPGAPVVAVSSPWRAPEHGLFVHLHALEAVRDPSPVPMRPDATRTGPALRWRLQLLIGAFGPDDGATHRLAGRVAVCLARAPLLDGTALAAAAGALGLASEPVAAGHARALAAPIALTDMTSLWQRFAPMRYSLSQAATLDVQL